MWDAPSSLAALLLAFLVNMTAFPLTSGLLPYVAREIYHIDQTGLGTLIASFAIGVAARLDRDQHGRAADPPGAHDAGVRRRLVRDAAGVRAHAGRAAGRAVLLLAGLAQSLSLVPMSVMLLHGAGARFRGRVMGLRMLAIYGLPLGLMAAGALIDRFGFPLATTLLCSSGLVLTMAIAVHWRAALWPREAAANAR